MQKKTQKNYEQMVNAIEDMGNRWKSSFVARKSVKEFSGGVISGRTMANEDSLGRGIEDRFYLANQVCYPVESLINWLKTRTTRNWGNEKMA